MVMLTLPRLAFFFFLMKCSFVKKTTSVSFYIWKGYNSFFFFPPSLPLCVNSLLVYLGIKQPFLMSSGSQGSGRTAVTSSSLASDFTHLPHTEGPRKWGATSPSLAFSWRRGFRHHAYLAPRGLTFCYQRPAQPRRKCRKQLSLHRCLPGKKKKKKQQEVRSSPWPQLPSRVLPSGSYDDPFHSLLIL